MHFQMSKRKIDCTLNEFVIQYLKKAKYEKTSKLIAGNNGESKESNERICEKFMNYLKRREAERKIQKDDDLGFEINFGAYQQEVKVCLDFTLITYSIFF